MSLDDRSLREHLDRRAHAGLSNPDDLAEVVIARLPDVEPARWWHGFDARARFLGIAAAAAAVVVVAAFVLPPWSESGPGSPSASPGIPTTAPTGAPAAAPTPLIDTGKISVLDLSLSTGKLVLDGLETSDVTLSVTFGGEVVAMGQMDLSTTPLACLTRDQPATGGSAFVQMVNDFTRLAGTNTWDATFRFTSSQAGVWHVTCLQAHDAASNALANDSVGIDPFALGWSPVLTVEGTHRPNVTMGFKPDPAASGEPLEVLGRVTDENGAPFAGARITIGRDNVCAEGGAGEVVTTDSDGHYSYPIEHADRYAICAWMLEKPGAFPNPYQSSELNGIYADVFAHPDVR
jgi:hypothetical protein